MRHLRIWLLAGAAVAAVAPVAASAQSAREIALEARLKQLEAAVGELRAELQSSRAETARAQEQAVATTARVTAIESRPAASPAPLPVAAPANGFRSGGTTISIGGFIKTVATFSQWDDGAVAANSLGRDFYLPSAIPVGGASGTSNNDFSAKQTRLWLNLSSDVGGKLLKGYVETDFQTSPGPQGSERTTNGYNLALRRAYLQYDRLTIGQDWTTFQNVAVLPESTDFVGASEGTVFVRQPLVRVSLPVGKGATLHASIENGETASASTGAPALVENDADKIPDIAARFAYAGGWGELSVAGVVRQLSVNATNDKVAGWGVSGAAKLFLDGAKRHDLRIMASYGSGIGRYIGLNFAPDVVLVPGTGQLETPNVLAALAAARISLTPKVRANLIGSYQSVDYPDGLAGMAGFNKTAWSVAANLFYAPVKGLDLGFEYRHGQRELVSGATGQLDRFEFAAKYGF